MPALVLVLDQGGHSSRALVFDETGAVVAQASQPVSTVYQQEAHVEQDPEEILASLHHVLDDVSLQLGARCAGIRAAALIAQRSSLLAWDRRTGRPLSPVLSWQDTRNGSWLERVIDGQRDNVRKQTGLFPNAHYGASKVRWLLDHVPAVQEARIAGTLCIAPLASFLQQRLAGSQEPVVDAVIASRSLLTSLGATAWAGNLLSLFSIPETVLPAIKPTLADYGVIHVGSISVPLRLLGGDQSFFSLSHGKLFSADTVFINAGTGAFVQQPLAASAVPDRLLCAALRIAGDERETVMVAEGTVNAAATALDWFWQQHGVAPFSADDWNAAAVQAAQDPSRVPLFCNRVTASGSPDWLSAGVPHFTVDAPVPLQAVAVLESIVFALQRNMDYLAAVRPHRKIVVSGGLSQLEVFCQRLSALVQCPVWRSDDVEACARGAAMQLLPEAAGHPAYREYLPQDNPALRQRYRQWSAMMDQLAAAG